MSRLRNRDLSHGFFPSVLLISCSIFIACEPDNEIVFSGASFSQQRAGLQAQDLGQAELTPWAVMHMLLLFDESEQLELHGKKVALGQILREAHLMDFEPLIAHETDTRVETRQSLYGFELEDHFGQYWALRAMGADLRNDGSPELWRRIGRAFLELASELPEQEEPSWLLIAGGLAHRHLRGEVPRDSLGGTPRPSQGEREAAALRVEIVAKVEAILETHRYDRLIPACGALHAAVAGAICQDMPFADPHMREGLAEEMQSFRDEIGAEAGEDGYVEYPGLHNSFYEVLPSDEVRVLGHLVELLSFLDGPYSQDEGRIIARLRRKIRTLGVSSRELGDACHALAALKRIDLRSSES